MENLFGGWEFQQSSRQGQSRLALVKLRAAFSLPWDQLGLLNLPPFPRGPAMPHSCYHYSLTWMSSLLCQSYPGSLSPSIHHPLLLTLPCLICPLHSGTKLSAWGLHLPGEMHSHLAQPEQYLQVVLDDSTGWIRSQGSKWAACFSLKYTTHSTQGKS